MNDHPQSGGEIPDVPLQPGDEIPTMPGYTVGRCGHRVANSEWRAGFRACERCPDKAQGKADE